MTETKWDIATPDGHRIYGVKTTKAEKPDSAVFIVHGLTGNMNEYAIKRAADLLSGKHDVYRFNLYDGEPSARALLDCTLQTHADDLNIVLEHFYGAYGKVFLIGHSYGGPTIMLAKSRKITAVSLWDPSFDLKSARAKFAHVYRETEDSVIIDWGVSTLIGKEMYRQKDSFDEAACIALAKAYGHPVQVIFAGKGIYAGMPYSYDSFGHPRNVREIVAQAGHCFNEGDSCDELLERTACWFDSFPEG